MKITRSNVASVSASTNTSGFAANMSNCLGTDVEGGFDMGMFGESDEFFTREDLDYLADEVSTKLQSLYPDMQIFCKGSYVENNVIEMDFSIESDDNSIECTVSDKVDFRRIKRPSDLLKYVDTFVDLVAADIEEM